MVEDAETWRGAAIEDDKEDERLVLKLGLAKGEKKDLERFELRCRRLTSRGVVVMVGVMQPMVPMEKSVKGQMIGKCSKYEFFGFLDQRVNPGITRGRGKFLIFSGLNDLIR
ncbi:hypothetical protein L1049_016940 [Liquidambar formosana]|uniref:Uncharacterized protein n=1 Tax=Liquidambar formosana TaxID=63359 RepID=A0AAP0S6T6_LIQFO